MNPAPCLISAGLLHLACASAVDVPNEPDATGSTYPALPALVDQPTAKDAACSTTAECIARHAGAPYRCQPSSHACVALLSDDCPRYLANDADIASEDAMYIGLLIVDDANGVEGEAAVELARSEISTALGGGVRTSPGSAIHPLVIIACDTDGTDPGGAARHLVQEVNVSALLGGFISSSVLSVARDYTIPGGVLQIAPSATSDAISVLVDQDLVYRAQTPGDISFQVLTPFIEQIIEPAILASGAASAGEPLRVMLVYDPDEGGQSEAATIAKYLSVNGQPVARDGSAFYRELRLDPLERLDPQPLSVVAARSIINFQPDIIIYQTQDASIAPAVESGWPPGISRPHFIVSAALGARLLEFVGRDAALRRRAFSFVGLPVGFDPAKFDAWAASLRSSSPALTAPTSRVYGPHLYDSLYMLAYAISTLDDRPPTGLNLVPGFRRLGGPGTSIEFGPGGLQSGMDELAAGRSIDYAGVSGAFRYTPAGDRVGLAATGCVAVDDAGDPVGWEPSGFVYDTATHTIESAVISCR